MLPLLILAGLVFGASTAFYSQSEFGYMACLLLIFLVGHYAGFVSAKTRLLMISRVKESGECPHEDEANILREDLIWLFKAIEEIDTPKGLEDIRATNKRINEIKQRISL
jgi:CRISPR/Cas system-associated protein Csm6